MSRLVDIERLLSGVSDQDPCGPDLEHGPDFRALEIAAAGKPERQVGETVEAAEPPDWRDVRKRAETLLESTKDLRVAIHLARALVFTDGFSGLFDGLAVVAGLVEQHWDGFHPRLDPEDDNDPTMRINSLMSLCDPSWFVAGVRLAPLVESSALGRFSLRDQMIASGELPKPAQATADELPSMARLEGAFRSAKLESLTAIANGITGAIAELQRIETLITDKVGTSRAPSFEPLRRVLVQAQKVVSPQVGARGAATATPAPSATNGGAVANPDFDSTAGGAPQHGSPFVPGDLRSREDVVRVLDRVCAYYERYEPSSPVPLLVRRAQRLATMSFVDIVKNLVPDAMNQLAVVRGPDEESS